MRRTLTKEEWLYLLQLVDGSEELQVLVIHSAPPEPNVVGRKFVCNPEYYERMQFTIDLVGAEEVFPPLARDGFHRFGTATK
jgi:hypothetical protein